MKSAGAQQGSVFLKSAASQFSSKRLAGYGNRGGAMWVRGATWLAVGIMGMSAPENRLTAGGVFGGQVSESAGRIAEQTGEASSESPSEQLWRGARTGDLELVQGALAAGAEVNAATPYGSTALCFAAERGHLSVVDHLLNAGANPNVADTFYKLSPLDWARANQHNEIVDRLLRAGLANNDQLLWEAVNAKNLTFLKSILAAERSSPEALSRAKQLAVQSKSENVLAAFADLDIQPLEVREVSAADLPEFVGEFVDESGAVVAKTSVLDGSLRLSWDSGGPQRLIPLAAADTFAEGLNDLQFEREAGAIIGLSRKSGGETRRLTKGTAQPAAEGTAREPAATEGERKGPELRPFAPTADDLAVSSVNWPGFRGTRNRGIAEGQHPPTQWRGLADDDGPAQNLRWKTPLPGLGNSCPCIWGDRLYVTSAVSEAGDRDVRIGNYGDVQSVEDDSIYDFRLYCLNKRTGEVLWEKTLHTARPAVKRHSKSSHANPTVATDGQHIVAFFGSEGLYCLNPEGELLWSKNLGFLDSGWFLDPGYQWGFGSSPVIFENRIILQCDIQRDSFLVALELTTGNELWRTPRNEIPSWPTPCVHRFGDLPMIITHGTRAARGYDARDGVELWSIPDHSEIVAPSPFVAHDLIYICSGYAPIQPIVAIRPSARGTIQLPDRLNDAGERTPPAPEQIAWSSLKGGPYMPTPLVYGDNLYVCSNTGILTCYRATTGEEVYKERLKLGGAASFTASPIAADGHLYFAAEDGRVAVVKAGDEFELVSVNPSGEKVLSTPAISEGLFFLRTIDSLIAFGEE